MKGSKGIAMASMLILTSFLVMMGMTEEVDAATLTVGSDQTYKKIQWAIDNATSGDIIRVHAGSYEENIVVNKSVTLRGNGSGESHIEGDGTDDAVTVEASNSVIEGFSITVGTRSGSHAGIFIDSSYDYVKIESCNITNSYYGIRADGSSSTASEYDRIFNNTATGCDYGIYLDYSDYSLVRFNNFSGNDNYGIYSYYTQYAMIENNTANNNDYGIRNYHGDYSKLANNSFDMNRYGIYNYYTDYGELHNNLVNHSEDYGLYNYYSDSSVWENNTVWNSGYPSYEDGYYGMRIYNSGSLVFKNNSFHNCGVYMEGSTKTDWTSIIAQDNEVNGKDLVILKNTNNYKIPSGAGQVILIDCGSITVENQNLSWASAGVIAAFSTSIDVDNCDLGYNNYGVHYYGYGEDMKYMNVTNSYINHTEGYAVYYEGTRACEYSNVSSNEITGGDDGIYFDMSSSSSYSVKYNHITHNTIRDIDDDVIELEYSSYSRIDNNDIIGGDYGIYTDSSSTKSFQYSKVNNNTLASLDRGIYLDYGDNSLVDNNTVKNCEEGLYIYYTDNAQISNNTVKDSTDEAIYLYSSDYNVIRDNEINGSLEEGIYVTSADNNNINNNSVMDCITGGVYISSGSNNVYDRNDLTGCGFYFGTSSSTYWTSNNIKSSNKVNSKEVYIKTNTANLNIPSDVGQVLLYSCDGATLKNAEIKEATVGVQLAYSDHVYIENSILNDNAWGVEMYRSDYTGIKNSTISDNLITGIVNEYSDYGHIFNNLLDSNGYPSHESGEYGLEVYYSENVHVENNTFKESGLYLYGSTSTKNDYNTHDISNNTVNGRDLLYLNGNSSETLKGSYGQIILVDTTDITIKDQDLSKASIGVTIVFSSKLHLEDLECNWNYYGIYFDSDDQNTDNNTIEDCEASYNVDDGIYFYSGSSETADDNRIANSTITENGDYGIYFYYPDKGNVLFNNTITGNEDDGVYIYGSSSSNILDLELRNNTLNDNYYGAYMYYTIDAVVQNNSFNDNEYYGMYFRYGDRTEISNNTAMRNDNDGFNIYDAESVYINNNTAGNNGGNGMDIYKGLTSSFNGDITYNVLIMNEENGIELDSGYRVVKNNTFIGNDLYALDVDGTYADDNQIDHNIFKDNNVDGDSQSYDDESDNKWDDGSEGNYWDDHQSPDSDSNGIVDEPYLLEGSAGSKDNYPLIIENSAPSITTTDVTTATEETEYKVDYQASDSDSDDIHIWTMHTNSSFLDIDSGSGVLSGTPDDPDIGIFFVEVTVYDKYGAKDSTNFTLVVSNVNDDPVIITDNVLTTSQRKKYSVDYDATDADPTDDKLTWAVDTNSTFLSIDSTTGLLEGTPLKANIGIWWVNVSVRDGNGGSDWTNFTLTVEAANDIPEITIDTGYTSAVEDSEYQADFDVDDLDDDDVHTWTLYTNASFLSIASDTGVLSGTPDNSNVGDFWVNVTVDDGSGGTDWMNFTLSVDNVNDDPEILTDPQGTATEDQLYSQDFEGEDIDPTQDTLTWSLSTDATFLSLSGQTVSGTPSNADVGSYYVNITVTDGNGGSDWLNYTLTVENVNDPPVIMTDVQDTATEDQLYSLDLVAVDIDPTKDILTWGLNTDATFLTLDTIAEEISGTPTNDDVGFFTVNISVNDGNGGWDWLEFTLEVQNTNDAPQINTTDLGEATEDELFFIMMEGWDMDPTNDDLTWSLDGSPDWLTIDPDTGNLSGTPTNEDVVEGEWNVIVNLTDEHGLWDTSTYMLDVINTNDDPVITTETIPDATEDKLYWTLLDGYDVDPTNDILTWSIDTKADFLSIGGSSGNISGTPTNDDVGEWWVIIYLRDSNGGESEVNLTFEVLNVNDDPEILNTPTEDAVEDELFYFMFIGNDTDPTEDVLTWSLDTEAPFLTIDIDTGNLSGTPNNDHVGEWEVNVSVSDGNGGTEYVMFTLEVLNVNDDPVITSEDKTEATEDELFFNVYEGIDIDPTGDSFTWDLTTNADFLSIDPQGGNLSGTPENDDVGEWWVNVSLRDGNGGLDWSNFTLTVDNVNDGPILNVTSIDEIIDEDSDGLELDLSDIFSDVDGDELTYESGETRNFTITIEDGIAKIVPISNWSGTEEITLTASDGVEVVSIDVSISVEEINDPPTSVRIIDRDRYVEGGDQTISAEAEDPDLAYGDTLSYTWSTETGEIGTGESINMSLPAGEYVVTVTVTDSQGLSTSENINVLVEEAPEEGDGGFPWWIFVLIAVVIIIIIAIVVFLLLGRKKKKEEEEREEAPGEIPTEERFAGMSEAYTGGVEGQIPAGAENEDVGTGPERPLYHEEGQAEVGGPIYETAQPSAYTPEEPMPPTPQVPETYEQESIPREEPVPEPPETHEISEQDTIPAEEPIEQPLTVSETPDEEVYSQKEEAVQKPPSLEDLPTQEEVPEPPSGPTEETSSGLPEPPKPPRFEEKE